MLSSKAFRGALAFLLCASIALLSVSPAFAEESTAPSLSVSSTPESALATGEQLETSGRWAEAIEFYEEALKRWDDNESLNYALRRTRIHFGIHRRYSDVSFRNALLTRGRSESLDLLEDIMSRIQFEYVDAVSATRLVAHGTESLYMALGNEQFLKHHFNGNRDSGITKLRETLIRNFWNRRLESRYEARAAVSQVCEIAARETGLPGSAVVMEYIFGCCNALDEYSNFLTPDRYNDLFGSIQGELVGIGIEMRAESGRGLHLVNVLLNSPAEEGGLRPDDYIVAIDGVDCRNMTTDEAAEYLRGSGGTQVALTYESPDGQQRTSQFTRRRVNVLSVTRTMMLDDTNGIGYIRMEGFQNSTAEELDQALRSLERQGMRGLIWDLRGNPGGLLETAAAVLDRFLDNGVLVSTRGRAPEQNQVFRAHNYNTRKYPLALIIDENSASASEIVAGAIRDHRRGTIIGRSSYGKWSVQSIIHLPGQTGLKLTTAKFYSPADHNYAGVGMEPDVLVPEPKDARVSFYRGRTVDDIRADMDVARAIEVLAGRLSQN
jgi:carboxyl-terminal processing protease